MALNAEAMIRDLLSDVFTKDIAPEDRPAFNRMAMCAHEFAAFRNKNKEAQVRILAGLVSAFAVELYRTREALKAAKATKN